MELRSIENDGYDFCLSLASKYLEQGKLVCFPTETFYALGGKYDNEDALLRIIRLKGRPSSKVFSLIIGNKSHLNFLVADTTPLEKSIIDNVWPSAVTLVIRASKGLLPHVVDKRGTVAVRMPAQSFALDLAKRLEFPITATSTNPSGMPPARSAEEVRKYFPEGIDLLIRGHECTAYLPSTIIEVKGERIRVIREGVVTLSEIMNLLEKND